MTAAAEKLRALAADVEAKRAIVLEVEELRGEEGVPLRSVVLPVGYRLVYLRGPELLVLYMDYQATDDDFDAAMAVVQQWQQDINAKSGQ
jgi:hypothetical protein